ncbi:MAG TPA: hypothetical protein VFW90_03150 [Candidatus Saccharimonadales bacterium]|nr:hypothetical protein [Candidatus Saccharimonadales bacterium]
MLAVVCLLGLVALVLLTEFLGKQKLLKGEYKRKFLHITAGSFIAFWPWLVGWGELQILSLIVLAIVLTNHYKKFWNYNRSKGANTYGDVFMGLAVVTTSFVAHNKTFFTLAILLVALADGLAAISGITYGKNWDYKVFGNKKTVIGSMVFWLVTACIFGGGLLTAHELFTLQDYYLMLLLLPPLFTLVENISGFGLDNLALPLLAVVILRLTQF